MFWVLFIEGCAFALHGINSFQNVPATLITGFLFSLAIGALAILVGLLFRTQKYVIQAVVTSSIPCVFITGNLFPAQNIPLIMRGISWFFPSTPGATAKVRTSQAGAGVFEVLPYLGNLALLWLLYSALAWLLGRRMKQQAGP